MTNALNTFCSLIAQAETSKGLFCYLREQRIPIDTSDLLRWQWVLAVSALDKYIHDIVRIGMVQEFQGTKPQTEKYKAFRIDMDSYIYLSSAVSPEIVFENEIFRQHSHLSFQYPEKIADALSYIWTQNNKWETISQNMATPISAKDLKTKLTNIIVRRNQIVHEGDCIVTVFPIQQQPMQASDVEDVIAFITELVHAIDCIIVNLT